MANVNPAHKVVLHAQLSHHAFNVNLDLSSDRILAYFPVNKDVINAIQIIPKCVQNVLLDTKFRQMAHANQTLVAMRCRTVYYAQKDTFF